MDRKREMDRVYRERTKDVRKAYQRVYYIEQIKTDSDLMERRRKQNAEYKRAHRAKINEQERARYRRHKILQISPSTP